MCSDGWDNVISLCSDVNMEMIARTTSGFSGMMGKSIGGFSYIYITGDIVIPYCTSLGGGFPLHHWEGVPLTSLGGGSPYIIGRRALTFPLHHWEGPSHSPYITGGVLTFPLHHWEGPSHSPYITGRGPHIPLTSLGGALTFPLHHWGYPHVPLHVH